MEPQPGDGCPHHTICPGVSCPETALVARLIGGSYLLMAYLHRESAAFVAGTAVDLLDQALQAAFGYPTAEVASRKGNPTPEDGALLTKRVQP